MFDFGFLVDVLISWLGFGFGLFVVGFLVF